MAEGHSTYFLDTSALAKLYHQEPGSELVEAWASDCLRARKFWLELKKAETHGSLIFSTVFNI